VLIEAALPPDGAACTARLRAGFLS